MSESTIKHILVDQLKDMYSAEKQVITALETVIEQASDEHLKNILAHHLKETEIHLTRLEQIAQESQLSIQSSHHCKGMEGIVRELHEVIQQYTDSFQKDAALALAARKLEHYETAGYLSAILLARSLEETQIITILDQTLAEEKEADNKLVTLAEETLLKKLTEVE